MCLDTRTNKTVAIKEMEIYEPEDLEVYQTEVSVHRSIVHPNIAKFIDAFAEKDNYYIVLEYCSGGDLEKLIKQRKRTKKFFTEEELTKLYTQLADALFYLHQDRRILHRDIKSQNVFVRDIESLEVCLGDFGLAKQTMRKTVMNQTTAGTPLYLAPEQMRNEPYNDKADIWSLGVLFYEMAALDYPFMAESALALAKVVVDQKHKPLASGYSTLLRDLVESMLEKQPANRPTMFQLFNSEFFFTV